MNRDVVCSLWNRACLSCEIDSTLIQWHRKYTENNWQRTRQWVGVFYFKRAAAREILFERGGGVGHKVGPSVFWGGSVPPRAPPLDTPLPLGLFVITQPAFQRWF